MVLYTILQKWFQDMKLEIYLAVILKMSMEHIAVINNHSSMGHSLCKLLFSIVRPETCKPTKMVTKSSTVCKNFVVIILSTALSKNLKNLLSHRKLSIEILHEASVPT